MEKVKTNYTPEEVSAKTNVTVAELLNSLGEDVNSLRSINEYLSEKLEKLEAKMNIIQQVMNF